MKWLAMACLLAGCTSGVETEIQISWTASSNPLLSRVAVDGVELAADAPTTIAQTVPSYDDAVFNYHPAVELTVNGVVQTIPIQLPGGCGDEVAYVFGVYSISTSSTLNLVSVQRGGCCWFNGDCDRRVY